MAPTLGCNVWATLIITSFFALSCSEKGSFIERKVGEDNLVGDADGESGSAGELPDVPENRAAIDRFQQTQKSKLDVLWVIDNSASMAPYQQLLSDNIGQFLDGASSWNIDIQMGVTSTDMCQSKRPLDPALVFCPDKFETTPGLRGRLAGGRVIKGLDQGARDQFAGLAMIGTYGSSFEHGLSAAKASVENSLAGNNGGLVRDGAFLSVVIVSDEEDDGVGLSRPDEKDIVWAETGLTSYRFTANDLVSYLSTVKAQGTFSVSSVTGFKSGGSSTGGCRDGGSLEVGAEQLKAADLSGGFKLDICTDEWAQGLAAMANNIAAQLNSFRLSHAPSRPLDIQVYVDGQQVKSGWHYVESRQSIVFDADEVPPFGAQIVVKYVY